MAFKKSTRKFARKGFKKTYKRKSSRRGTSSITRTVKKVMSRMAETKYKSAGGGIIITGYAGASPTQICLTPNPAILISQGSGQGDRIGNKIRIKKATFSCVMTPSAYDVIVNPVVVPQEVRMVIAKSKGTPLSAPAIATFFQNGDTSATPSGQLGDMIRPINTNTMTVYKQKFCKLGNAFVGGTSYQAGSQGFTNNDFKLNVKWKIDITKYIPTVIEWNDSNAGQPSSDQVYATWFLAAADGTTNSSSQAAGMNYFIDYEFLDF